jgi:hypothetical protein
MKTAPGPSPWYLSIYPKLSTTFGELAWGTDENGNTVLKTIEGFPLAILGNYCYVCSLSHTRFLVWYEECGKQFKFDVIDASKLQIINDTPLALHRLKEERKKVVIFNDAITSFAMPTSIAEGIRIIEFPEVLKEIEELLVLFRPNPYPDKMNLCLMIMHPRENTLEVIPQEWYNEGKFDYGYQWITRVARDPITAKIFGEGIRLGEFVLDDENRKIEKWLKFDPFYHPFRG